MIVQDVLAGKGRSVVTISPNASISELVAALAEHGIGALVVSTDGTRIDGIVSERDIARAMHKHGAAVLHMHVSEMMTSDVQTCRPGDRISDIARIMTERRFRHLPVVDGDALVGIVSIGDVVKKRIDELETESGHLMDYLTSP